MTDAPEDPDRFAPVRDAFASAEDVDLPEGAGSVPPGGPPPRTPPDVDADDPPSDPVRAAARQPLNDYGNGQRFVIHHGLDTMFVPRVGWFTWDEMRWLKDPDEMAVRAKAQGLAELIVQEVDWIEPTPREMKVIARERELQERLFKLEEMAPADRAEDHGAELATIRTELKGIEATLKSYKSRIGRLLTHAKNAGNSGPLQHMVEEAEVPLSVPVEALDADPMAVNTMSGLLRFRVEDMRNDGAGKVASVELVPHAREQLQSKLMPVEYDPQATAPRFQQYLEEVQPDREMRAFLQRWFGLSMTALPIQRMVFFHGTGANGKSVLTDLMGRIMGDYSVAVRIESLTGTNRRGGGDATPDLIPLMGARSARTTEPDQGERLQEGLIKELTGGEKMLVRELHKGFIEMRPVFKLTMAGNHKPDIKGGDDGIWRRMLLVPWDVQIPEDKRIPLDEFVDILFAEGPGVLNWLVEGVIDYLEAGLRPPDTVTEATREYREDSDPISAFLTSCCVITADHVDRILSSEIANAFNYYQMERAQNTWRPGTFTRQFAAKVRTWKHPQTGLAIEKSKASLSQYSGLRWTDDFGRRWRAAPKDAQGRALSVSNSDDASPDPFFGSNREDGED